MLGGTLGVLSIVQVGGTGTVLRLLTGFAVAMHVWLGSLATSSNCFFSENFGLLMFLILFRLPLFLSFERVTFGFGSGFWAPECFHSRLSSVCSHIFSMARIHQKWRQIAGGRAIARQSYKYVVPRTFSITSVHLVESFPVTSVFSECSWPEGCLAIVIVLFQVVLIEGTHVSLVWLWEIRGSM